MRDIIQKKVDKHGYRNEINLGTLQHYIGNNLKGLAIPYIKYNSRPLDRENPLYKIYTIGMPYKERMEYNKYLGIYHYTLLQYTL